MQGLIGSHPKRLFSVALSTTNPTSPMWRPSALHEKHILLFDSVCIPDLTHLTSLYPTCSYFICPSPVLSAPPSVHQTELTRSRLLPLTVCRELLKNYSESKLHAGLGPNLSHKRFLPCSPSRPESQLGIIYLCFCNWCVFTWLGDWPTTTPSLSRLLRHAGEEKWGESLP